MKTTGLHILCLIFSQKEKNGLITQFLDGRGMIIPITLFSALSFMLQNRKFVSMQAFEDVFLCFPEHASMKQFSGFQELIPGSAFCHASVQRAWSFHLCRHQLCTLNGCSGGLLHASSSCWKSFLFVGRAFKNILTSRIIYFWINQMG